MSRPRRRKYIPLIRPTDKPAIWLNKERMEKYRPEMKKYYYDPTSTRTTSISSGSNIDHREAEVGAVGQVGRVGRKRSAKALAERTRRCLCAS